MRVFPGVHQRVRSRRLAHRFLLDAGRASRMRRRPVPLRYRRAETRFLDHRSSGPFFLPLTAQHMPSSCSLRPVSTELTRGLLALAALAAWALVATILVF